MNRAGCQQGSGESEEAETHLDVVVCLKVLTKSKDRKGILNL